MREIQVRRVRKGCTLGGFCLITRLKEPRSSSAGDSVTVMPGVQGSSWPSLTRQRPCCAFPDSPLPAPAPLPSGLKADVSQETGRQQGRERGSRLQGLFSRLRRRGHTRPWSGRTSSSDPWNDTGHRPRARASLSRRALGRGGWAPDCGESRGL